MALTLISFLVVISVLIFVHELGHFVTAKLSKIHVMEFAMGFPPRLLHVKRGETTYSLNALPLGGYVKMAGEEDPTAPRSLAGKPAPIRAIVIGAGATMNAVLAVVLFAVVAMIPKDIVSGDVTVVEVFPNSPAAAAGIQADDVIRGVNGETVRNSGDLTYQLRLRMGAEAKIEVERAGQMVQGTVVPRWRPPAGEGATGIVIRTDNVQIVKDSESFFPAMWSGVRRSGETMVLVKNEVTEWIAGTVEPSVTGPIGIAQLTGEVAGLGFIPLLELGALLSLNLAVMNILPLPALDGGRLFFLLIEVLRGGKRIPARKEALVHLAGFVILIGGVLIVSYFDIMRIARGDSLIGN